jgi:hypothetical protein
MQQKYGVTVVMQLTPVDTDAPSLDLKWETIVVEGEFRVLAQQVLEDVYHSIGETLGDLKKRFKPRVEED